MELLDTSTFADVNSFKHGETPLWQRSKQEVSYVETTGADRDR